MNYAAVDSVFTMNELVVDQETGNKHIRVLEINDNSGVFEKYNHNDLKTLSLEDIFCETNLTWFFQCALTCISGLPQIVEYDNHCKNTWFQIIFYGSTGNKFVALYTDISNRKKLERESELNLSKMNSFFEYSLVGKSITSLDGTIRVNKIFADIVGYTQEELNGIHWKLFTHPDDIELNNRELKKIIDKETDSVQFEKRYIHKNGKVVWVEIKTTLRYDECGNPDFFITEIIDITLRKKAELAIIRDKSRLESVHRMSNYQAANVADFILFCLNEVVKCSDSETAFLFDYNWSQQQFSFNSCSDTTLNQHSEVIKNIVERINKSQRFQNLIEDRKLIVVNKKEMTESNVNDSIIPVVNFIAVPVVYGGELVSVFVLINKDGEYDNDDTIHFSLIVDAVSKIVQRKIFEEKLIESDKRYDSFINNNADLMFVKDHSKKYLLINNSMSDFFGKTKNEIIGKTDQELGTDLLISPCHQSDTKVLDTQKIVVAEEKLGEKIYETTKFPVWVNNEIGIGAILHDITERKQTESKLLAKIDELEKLQKVTVGRELSMIELKEEVNKLLVEKGLQEKYNIVRSGFFNKC